jgi:hypothetical protein
MLEQHAKIHFTGDRIFFPLHCIKINQFGVDEAPFPENLEKTFWGSLPAWDDVLLVPGEIDVIVLWELLQLRNIMACSALHRYTGCFKVIGKLLFIFLTL